MIDLAAMTGIRVDQQSRTAHAQGGVTWGLFNRETQLHGLATTGGVISTTGIAGLSLGGGVGWLMSRHGLSIDNLLSVDLVLADCRAVTASAQENPDLFWAVRGGGGNFGVASSFEYRLHPVGPTITGGVIAYPFSQAWDVLRRFRDITASLPDELTVVAGLTHAPTGLVPRWRRWWSATAARWPMVTWRCSRSSCTARRRWRRSGRCHTRR